LRGLKCCWSVEKAGFERRWCGGFGPVEPFVLGMVLIDDFVE
jgi:hypothetical protein